MQANYRQFLHLHDILNKMGAVEAVVCCTLFDNTILSLFFFMVNKQLVGDSLEAFRLKNNKKSLIYRQNLYRA